MKSLTATILLAIAILVIWLWLHLKLQPVHEYPPPFAIGIHSTMTFTSGFVLVKVQSN